MSPPKTSWTYDVPLVPAPVTVTRWGHYGLPVVLFASAGGDSLEPERQRLIESLGALLESGRIKVYAVDGAAARTLVAGPPTGAAYSALRAFSDWVGGALVPQVRQDCQSDALESLAVGCAFGAGSALQALLCFPTLFRGALGVSGTYDFAAWLGPAPAIERVSPLQRIRQLPRGENLQCVRRRAITLASTEGDYDTPAATLEMASALREQGIEVRHETGRSGAGFGFASWRELLPRCLERWL